MDPHFSPLRQAQGAKSATTESDMTGMVYIVGGGPGDPGLITVKGLKYLQQAEVVLYDRLVAPELLAEAPANAELIDVGKEPTRHRRSQAEINALLVEKARSGYTVVRLKGGDPFVFGRGGEECLALAQAGIPFEVVPGISSAVAVPAYAGIPITYRNVASSFTVITGHSASTGAEASAVDGAMDWESLPKRGTLVFLMGVSHLPEIVQELLKRGWAEELPAAIIERGTTPQQRVLVGTLETIAGLAQAVEPPATLVVGEVVGLRSELGWFEKFNEEVFA